jgi:nucleotide-binding universal stress UspA family protein
MNILLYGGPAPWRDLVLQFSTPLVAQGATALTLVTGGGDSCYPLLQQAARQLSIPAHVPVMFRALPGNAQMAILAAAEVQNYDMVILGRFHQALTRRLPGVHSKTIAQRLEPSVLRVHGLARPIRHILLASGGNEHTLDKVRTTARLATLLGATVTVLYVYSQQSLFFEGFSDPQDAITEFLERDAPESRMLRKTTAMLQSRCVTTEVQVRTGPVLDEILAEIHSERYELLVIGAHRVESALDRILLEDITGDLLDLCPIPVLVIKNCPYNLG